MFASRVFPVLVLLGPLCLAAPALADDDLVTLPDERLQALAARFAKAAQGKAPGVWEEVQACYAAAEKNPSDLPDCLLLDTAGNVMEQLAVKRAGGGQLSDWYAAQVFSKRAGQHASEAFPDPRDYANFSSHNTSRFLKAVLLAIKDLPPILPAD